LGPARVAQPPRRENEKDADVMISDIDDGVILMARLFLATLFLIFGWRKLRDFSGTVSQMERDTSRRR
jgi:uncharacterized membrane protein YphA (DoxX/SURF4 family)